MKRLFFVLVIVFGFIFVFNTVEIDQSTFIKIPKTQRIEALAEQEFMIARNIQTNEIALESIYKTTQKIHSQSYKFVNNLQWEERGPDNWGGRTRTMALDPSDPTGNTIWSGGVAGGLWKCSNAFTDNYVWEHIDSYTGNTAISSIVVDPSNHDVIYVGTGEGWFNADAYAGDGIYRSIDGGVSWTRLESTNNANFRNIQKLLIVNDRLFACTKAAGLQMSKDRGETWVKSLGNGQFGFSERAADIDLGANGVLMACMGFGDTRDGVYKSDDLGNTWEYLILPGSVFRRSELAISPSNPDVMYVLKEDDISRSVEEIVKTTDGGRTWKILESPGAVGMQFFSRNQAWFDLSITVDPSNENRVFIGGVDLHLTENGGETWKQVSQWYGGDGIQYVHADQHFAQFLDQTGDRVAFTNDGGMYLTEEGQDTLPNIEWKNQGYNTIQFYACAVHPTADNYILGGTQDNGTYLFETDGVNSTTRVTGGDGAYCHIDRDNPNIQISSYVYNNYWVTTDNWNSNRRVTLGYNAGFFINPTDYDDDNDMLICSGNTGKIITLDVHTGIFDSVSISQISSVEVTAIKVHPFDNTQVFIGTSNGSVFRIDSLVQGSPNTTRLLEGIGNVRNIDFDLSNPDRILCIISNPGVPSIFISEDNGESWTNQDGNIPSIPIRWGLFSPSDPSSVILGTELGVWSAQSLEGNDTDWTYNSTGLPPTRVDMLEARWSDNLIVAATHGRGMYTAYTCSAEIDSDNDGFSCEEDCDDFNENINPGQEEITYNGIDDDCDPNTLDDDLDQDGYVLTDDCDDTNPSIYPYALEIEGNGIDENCDGNDTSVPCGSYYSGPWDIFAGGGQCYSGPVNTNWDIWSNESYIVRGLRESISYYFDFCDGFDTATFESKLSIYFYNASANTTGDMIVVSDSCYTEFTYASNTDFPDVLIVLNNANDCGGVYDISGNGTLSFGCLSTGVDEDGDGSTTDVDCDDTNADINPNLVEIPYNGIDDDCDENTPDDDIDGDGYPLADDCDDNNPDVSPGSPEIYFNNIDDDCNPNTADNDIDGDGWGIFDDCDESNPDINPGATEIPGNGIDEDCDGIDGSTSTLFENKEMVKVYPNPTNGQVYVDIALETDFLIEVYSVVGNKILETTNKTFDISKYADGSYIINVLNTNNGNRYSTNVILIK